MNEDVVISLGTNLGNKKSNLIFDGYPRNIKQASELENLLTKHNLSLDKIFFLFSILSIIIFSYKLEKKSIKNIRIGPSGIPTKPAK